MKIFSYKSKDTETNISFSHLQGGEMLQLNKSDIDHLHMNLKYGIFLVTGKISIENAQKITQLNHWASTPSESHNVIKKIQVQVAKADYTDRLLSFEGFPTCYLEEFSQTHMRYSLVIRRRNLANNIPTYVTHTELGGVSGTLIITPRSHEKTTLSALNMIGGIGLLTGLTLKAPVIVTIVFITHGTGMIIEAGCDLYFDIKGDHDKLGSFNPTRDFVYKGIGELLERATGHTINTDKIYNQINLALTFYTLINKLFTTYIGIKTSEGLGVYFKMKTKTVSVSKFGKKETSIRDYSNITPKILKEYGLDSYSTYRTINPIERSID